jgi:hypothetical protein
VKEREERRKETREGGRKDISPKKIYKRHIKKST